MSSDHACVHASTYNYSRKETSTATWHGNPQLVSQLGTTLGLRNPSSNAQCQQNHQVGMRQHKCRASVPRLTCSPPVSTPAVGTDTTERRILLICVPSVGAKENKALRGRRAMPEWARAGDRGWLVVGARNREICHLNSFNRHGTRK